MSGGRLPKRIVFGNLEGAVRRGRGGKEKEWKQHFGEIKNEVFFKERGLPSLKGPVG